MGPLPGSWLAARMADLTPDLQVHVCLSSGSVAESFHSLQSLSVSCFHVIFGLPGTCFPSTCRSKAVLTAPLEPSLLQNEAKILNAKPMDLVVTMFCGLTLQICLIIALSLHCRCWRFGFVNGQVALAWSNALCTQKLYTLPRVLKDGKWKLVAAPWTSSIKH